MTRQRLLRRLNDLEKGFAHLPVPRQAVDEGFSRFRVTGELPESELIAAAVIQRAKDGYSPTYTNDGDVDWGSTMASAIAAADHPKDELLHAIYDEAVHAPSIVRTAARLALKALAHDGKDVTATVLVGSSIEVPEGAFVGLHLLGFPERLAKPPYERQAERLFERSAVLRARQPCDASWSRALQEAMELFVTFGELPRDELLRAIVLAQGEANALLLHLMGRNVRDLLAAYARFDSGDDSAETADTLAALVVEAAR